MERLWIELGGEALDPIALNACPTRTVGLADGKVLEISIDQFLGFVRQNYLIGEAMTINLLRDGKRLDLKVKLK